MTKKSSPGKTCKAGASGPAKKRVWELDALRGFAIICMLVVHWFSFAQIFGGADVSWSPFAWFVKQYGGVFFIFLSGICASLGTKNIRRGIIVLCCGFALTFATGALCAAGLAPQEALIQWGILHLLGFCMISYSLYKKLPPLMVIIIAAAAIIAGYYFLFNLRMESNLLFIAGIRPRNFVSMDYEPVLPGLGWFMLGTVFGKRFYKKKKSLLPKACSGNFAIKFLSFIGRHSLEIYMLQMAAYYLIFREL